jgi:transcriptional regulator with XRE-family HTH domain
MGKMDDLTDKQIKNRWVEIKKQINERQLLAYRVGIPLEQWDKYMYSLPQKDEINRIYIAIQNDRTAKTLRIKEGLSQIVGYREAKEFSRKGGVSDTAIRDIIEGKKTMAGYDIINRLELFLNSVLTDFQLSIENPLTVKSYSLDYLGEISSDINKIASRLQQYSFKLSEMARTQKTDIDYLTKESLAPTHSLRSHIEELTELESKIDLFWNTYCRKKIIPSKSSH